MENNEYNRLIYENRLEELANITNISDLTRYDYLGKYLLEYLLEKNIHSRRMDSYAIANKDWINIYLKYNIIEPLINIETNNLFMMSSDKLILELLLEKLNDHNKMLLLQNMKKNNYWSYRMNESLIINLYAKYGIKLPRIFIELPTINDNKPSIPIKLEKLINEFKEAYNDTNAIVLDIYVNELIRNAKNNFEMTEIDIKRLIQFKRMHPYFKLTLYEFENDDDLSEGQYNIKLGRIVINLYEQGVLSHELSHMIYDQYERDYAHKSLNQYESIHKIINKRKLTKQIVDYLKDFHQRYDDTMILFKELYLANIKNKYGDYNAYVKGIGKDIVTNDIELVILDENDTSMYVDNDNLESILINILYSDEREYVNNLVDYYYREELALEGFLNDLLLGKLLNNKYDLEILRAHDADYFKDLEDSFNECLSGFYELKNSNKADILINKLRTIIGDGFVDFFDNYLKSNRWDRLKKHTR